MDDHNINFQKIAASLRSKSAFLAEWEGKPDYKLVQTQETYNSNYMVIRDGRLVLWARTVTGNSGNLFIHPREELVARMGEAEITNLEEGLKAAGH